MSDKEYKPNIPLAELSALMQPEQYENRPLWETDPDFLNPYKELPPLQTWARIGDRPALPKEGIITFSAKQKKGKSLSTYAIAIPLLSGNVFDTLTPIDRPNLVLVFDLEMSETTLINRVQSQIRTIGEYGIRFVVCPLKGKSIEERIAIITTKVERYNPQICIIDQGAKLVKDINGTAETNTVTDMLDKLSIGRSVWVVMHENKNNEDTNMRGHLGSYLSFAAVEAYTVDRKDGVFTITYKEGRDTDSENAVPIRFALDADAKIIDAAAIFRAARDKEADGWRNNFERIFGGDTQLQAGELVERLMKQDGLEKRAANTKLGKARDLGVIRKLNPNDHRSPYVMVYATD